MKDLSWKFVLPLAIISFALWTKWSMVYALPVDAPDIIMVGFPLAYAGDGWHTSLSLQIFFLELLVDLLTYYIFWFLIVWFVNSFVLRIRIKRIVTIVLLTVTAVISLLLIMIGANSTNVYFLKRPYDVEVLESGYKFIWDGNPRPDNFDYEGYEKRRKQKETDISNAK